MYYSITFLLLSKEKPEYKIEVSSSVVQVGILLQIEVIFFCNFSLLIFSLLPFIIFFYG